MLWLNFPILDIYFFMSKTLRAIKKKGQLHKEKLFAFFIETLQKVE